MPAWGGGGGSESRCPTGGLGPRRRRLSRGGRRGCALIAGVDAAAAARSERLCAPAPGPGCRELGPGPASSRLLETCSRARRGWVAAAGAALGRGQSRAVPPCRAALGACHPPGTRPAVGHPGPPSAAPGVREGRMGERGGGE
jgi:hypothetical protein